MGKHISFFVFMLAAAAVLATSLFLIDKRNTTAEGFLFTHDGVLQVEEAVKFTLKGKNPYTENYFNTPLEKWGGLIELNGANPALYHLAYLPFNILFSIPFYLASNASFNFFDERIVYLFSFFLTIFLIFKWPDKRLLSKIFFLAFIVLNPLFMIYFFEGRNDIFVLSWIILSVYFLALKKFDYSSIALALAATSKQSSWFLLPFYFAYLFFLEPANLRLLQKIKNVFMQTRLFFATAGAILIPFLSWDYRSFIDDIINYSNGTSFASYPMKSESGWGFMQLILNEKLAASPSDYWPFWIPQVLICFPLLYLLLKIQKKSNTPGQMIFGFALLLFVFWSLSRFFSNNYLGFTMILFYFAFFLSVQDNKLRQDQTKNT